MNVAPPDHQSVPLLRGSEEQVTKLRKRLEERFSETCRSLTMWWPFASSSAKAIPVTSIPKWRMCCGAASPMAGGLRPPHARAENRCKRYTACRTRPEQGGDSRRDLPCAAAWRVPRRPRTCYRRRPTTHPHWLIPRPGAGQTARNPQVRRGGLARDCGRLGSSKRGRFGRRPVSFCTPSPSRPYRQ
jgi:hypothetical protein